MLYAAVLLAALPFTDECEFFNPALIGALFLWNTFCLYL